MKVSIDDVLLNGDVKKEYTVNLKGKVYKSKALLGEGGFGLVYKMVDISDNNNVFALKVSKIQADKPRKEQLKNAKRENQLLIENARLPATINEVTIDTIANKIYSAMPILGGGDLFDYLDNEKINDMRISDRFKSVAELMDQLVELHNRTGTEAHLHLDIKPENVMMKSMGIGVESPLLIDFGLSSKYSPKDGEKFGKYREIKSGIKGTLYYISPETLKKGMSSNKSDIYSIGLVIVEMLGDTKTLVDYSEHISKKGQPLYDDYNIGDRLKVKGAMMKDTLPKFLNRMVAKDPKKRPAALEVSRFFRIMQRYSEGYEVIEAKCKSIDDIMEVKGVTVDTYQKASNKLKLEMLRTELFKGNGGVTGLLEHYEDVDFEAMKADMEKIEAFIEDKGNDLFEGDSGVALSEKIVELAVARERKEIVKAVEAVDKSRAGEGLDEYSQCKEYCEYLKEECKINKLQARIMALGGNGEQSLQLAKDPVENRQKLLDRAKVCTVGSPLVELTEGDITQTKLEDHLIKSLHNSIQKLSGDDKLFIKLYEDPVKNRKALLKRAKKITPLSSLEEIVNLTPEKMNKLSWIRYVKPGKWKLRQDVISKIRSQGVPRNRQDSKVNPKKENKRGG